MRKTFYTNNKGKRFYVCDRKRCDNCIIECNHTSDITHALYEDHPAESFELTRDGSFFERIRK